MVRYELWTVQISPTGQVCIGPGDPHRAWLSVFRASSHSYVRSVRIAVTEALDAATRFKGT